MTKPSFGVCALVIAAALSQACKTDDPPNQPVSDGGTTEDGGNLPDGGDGGNAGLEFTTFTRELILTQTANHTLPATTEDRTFVDSEPADAFPPPFFQ